MDAENRCSPMLRLFALTVLLFGFGSLTAAGQTKPSALDRANEAASAGNYAQAYALYEEAYAEDPENILIYTNYAWYLFAGGRTEDAITVAESGYDLDPKNLMLLEEFALFCIDGGYDDGAIDLIEELIGLIPDVHTRMTIPYDVYDSEEAIYGSYGAFREVRKLYAEKISRAYPGFAADFEKYREARRLVDFFKSAEGMANIGKGIECAVKALGLYASIGDEIFEAQTALELGLIYQTLGQYSKASPLFLQSLSIYGKNHEAESLELASICVSLADVFRDAGEYAQAEPLYRSALTVREKALGRDDPRLAETLDQLAYIYHDVTEDEKAEPLLLRALAIRERALGPEHPDVANTLNDLGVLYYDMGEYAKAEPLYRRALAIREKALGPGHQDTAATLNFLAILFNTIDEYAKAEPLFQRIIAFKEKALGSDHPDLAESLHGFAVLYDNWGNLAEAEPLYLRALAIREKALGHDDPDTVNTLDCLALLYRSMEKYAKAESLYQSVLERRERSLGPEHPDVAGTLCSLAVLSFGSLEYAKTEGLLLRALAIKEKSLGPEHPDVAIVLNSLAILYQEMGEYAKEEPLINRAVEIQEKAPGTKNTDLAKSLSSQASLYFALADLKKAEPLFRRALEIRENALGSDDLQTASSRNSLALLYASLGDYAKAEPLYQGALAVFEKTLGPDHPDVAVLLGNMAKLYMGKEEDYKALKLLVRALDITEKKLGPDHPDVAVQINNLVYFYFSMGAFEDAVPLCQRSIALREKALGPNHPELASLLGNLAVLYAHLGDYANSEALFRRALAILEKALGSNHPRIALLFLNQTLSCIKQGNFAAALGYYQKGFSIQEKEIQNIFSFSTEQEKLRFIRTIQATYLEYLSMMQQYMTQDQDAIRFGLELVFRRKGIVLEAQSRANEALRAHLSESAKKDWDELSSLRSSLSRLLLNKPSDMSEDEYKEGAASLQKRIEGTEERLSEASALVAGNLRRRDIRVEDAAKALPRNSSLIEFVKIKDSIIAERISMDTMRYLAFILKPSGEVSLVDLGDIEPEARKALDWIRASLDDPYGEMVPQSIRSLENLYDKVWAPLESRLGGTTKVFLSPDGILNLVPFAALQDKAGKVLIERYTIGYLNSGRELAGTEGERPLPESGLLLVADPAYDGKPSKAAEKGSATRSRSLNAQFGALPGTAEEAKEVFALVDEGKGKKAVLTGLEATKAAVKSARSPRILHLATHGFFLPDEKLELEGIGFQNEGGLNPGGENPLVRSGLAFTGANRAAEANEGDDGILTALEISGMDLWGTELVVLSACETALGSVEVGEGVFGLRRSFGLAGAKALLMSLWPVSDAVTMEQMKDFYLGLDDKGTIDALRDAQLGTLRKLRTQGGDADPAVWAPFIIQGADVRGPGGR